MSLQAQKTISKTHDCFVRVEQQKLSNEIFGK